jgi:hypothetical protein
MVIINYSNPDDEGGTTQVAWRRRLTRQSAKADGTLSPAAPHRGV